MADRDWPPFLANAHAAQTHDETVAAGPALDPLPFPEPEIHPGSRDVEFLVSDSATGAERSEHLLARTVDEPDFAYRKIKTLQPIERNNREWGEVMLCLALERRNGDIDGVVFVEPPLESARMVAVKELRKEVVQEYLTMGGTENPYTEISAMQAIGDGIHVINCLEALQDGDNLWIVMPFCEGGDLWSVIHEVAAFPGIPEADARGRFREVLECLNYLQSQGVCHGDISPENVLIHNGRCILIDLGCCFRVPVSPTSAQRVMALPFRRRFGKNEYMSPEVFFLRFNFDGFAIDIWSAGITLFHMLTGQVLERSPIWAVVHGTLNNFINNAPRLQLLTQNANGVAFDLLNWVLREPAARFSLNSVLTHQWIAFQAVPFVPMQ